MKHKKLIEIPTLLYRHLGFCDLGSHFEALASVLQIFILGFASKKYDQTDSRAPKCLPRITQTVMYIVIIFHK
jgi:hypothetical protein